MSFQDMRSIGSTLLVALTIVSAASLSGRLFKENLDAERAEAATAKTSAVACVHLMQKAM